MVYVYIPETATWTDKVRMLQTTDPVLGGKDGASNWGAHDLTNRTAWLKKEFDHFKSRLPEGKLDQFLIGLEDGNYQLITPENMRLKLGLGNAATVDVVSSFGDNKKLAASQFLANEANKNATTAMGAANIANDKANTAQATADSAKLRAERTPLPTKDYLVIGQDSEKYRLISVNDLKTMLDIKAGLPIGHVHWHMFVMDGSLPLDGREVSRAEYPELFNFGKFFMISESDWWAHSNGYWGQCAYFSVGNGSTTFRLPSVPRYVKGGGTGYQDHGLPNIYGYVDSAGLFPAGQPSVGGALSLGNWANTSAMTTIQGSFHNLTFNAQAYNGIYGSSSTVETIAVKGFWQIKAR